MASISIIIPVFNRANTITMAIDSAIAQDYPIEEIIIIDDGSSDNLTQALSQYGNQITLIKHPTNLGASAARNTGIKYAKGEFIAFLDSDDQWLPHKLTTQLKFMQQYQLQNSCTLVNIARKGLPLQKIWRPYPNILSFEHFIWGCYVSPGSSLIANRELLLKIGSYNTDFPRYEDWDLLLRLSAHDAKGIGYLKQSCANIYVDKSFSSEKAFVALDKMLTYHYDDIKKISPKSGRKFKAAIAFNRAATYAAQGNTFNTIKQLLISFYLCPFNNWPIKTILANKLLHKLKWKTNHEL